MKGFEKNEQMVKEWTRWRVYMVSNYSITMIRQESWDYYVATWLDDIPQLCCDEMKYKGVEWMRHEAVSWNDLEDKDGMGWNETEGEVGVHTIRKDGKTHSETGMAWDGRIETRWESKDRMVQRDRDGGQGNRADMRWKWKGWNRKRIIWYETGKWDKDVDYTQKIAVGNQMTEVDGGITDWYNWRFLIVIRISSL